MAKTRATPTIIRTRVYQVFDGAGIVTSEAYDFKGNLQDRPARAAARPTSWR